MSRRSLFSVLSRLALCFACSAALGIAEDGHAAWLRYAPLPTQVARRYANVPGTLVALHSSAVMASARDEIARGMQSILGRGLRIAEQVPQDGAIVLGTYQEVAGLQIHTPADTTPDSYWIAVTRTRRGPVLVVSGSDDRGILYGAFALLRKVALRQSLNHLNEHSAPFANIRWINQWDNLDGSIERGYGGRSIFFRDGHVLADLKNASDYARLLASVGINGCTVNNVNANPQVLAPDFLRQVASLAAALRPWGLRLSLAVDLGSPKTIGGLDTFDPLDPRVAAWWKAKVDTIYGSIPDFGGFVLKADSEGRVGPSTYGRTHADAANVLAAALAPHGGVIVYRGFVYNHHMDWRDVKNDRARAAWDNFHPLDGKFTENAAVQIKYGPIDFQVREPVSPLIGALPHTNQTLELQITQEYTGQQRQLCYLVPMWKQILDFDLRVDNQSTPVKALSSGRTFHRPRGGFVGVANVGDDPNWLGFDLAQANLYGFARLAWDPDLTAERITKEWTEQTFGNQPEVVETVAALLLKSWSVYEGYTGVLGLQTLTDILHSHYGPNVSSAEHNGWGQWIRADRQGVGMDRSVATGTGFSGQYPPEIAARFESLATTPDNLLLFFHHVPYTYQLHFGQSVIQTIYDAHYRAALEAESFPVAWQTLKGKLDEPRYADVLKHLAYQAGFAVVWRDSICRWFLNQSGIDDAQQRVGHYSNRAEAESMQLDGYTRIEITPPENASGGKGVVCGGTQHECSASFVYKGPSGNYDLDVEYFDLNNGRASFTLLVNERPLDSWQADMWLPGIVPNGDTSVRHRTHQVQLKANDRIRLTGRPDGGDTAGLDYLAIEPMARKRN